MTSSSARWRIPSCASASRPRTQPDYRLLRRSATVAEDPAGGPPVASPDPGDDYLIALAVNERAALVSGDRHVLSIGGDLPIYAPADFLRHIEPGLS